MNVQTMPFVAKAAKPAPTFAQVLPQRWEREAAASAESRARGSTSDDPARRTAGEEWFGKAMERSDLRLSKDIASAVIAGPADAVAIVDYLLTEQERDPVYVGDAQNLERLLGALRAYLQPKTPDATIASLFAEWWSLDRTEPADDAEDNANNDRMLQAERQMLTLPTATAADLAMKLIANTYHGGFCVGRDLTKSLYQIAGIAEIPPSILRQIDGDEADENAEREAEPA
ncbi:MAG: hypothetical protein J0H08_09695 [Rhizobiales bacterium]|nr:hypothetical protein [Hyphomicrobiales bacterium]